MWERILTHFAAHQRAAGLAERTIRSRDETIRKFIAFAQRTPTQVEKIDFIEFLARNNQRTGKPLAPGTKQVERSYLQCFGSFLVEEGYLAYDPTAQLPRVKVPRRRARPLARIHIAAMVDSRTWQSTRDMIVIAAVTGLRINEIVKICGEHFDRFTGTLRTIRKGGLEQIIHLPPEILEIAHRMPATGWWFPSKYKNAEFPEGGGHILMKSASTRISIVLRKVGITDPRITGHSLRHFYATELLRQGVAIRVVQEMLGHASLNTTQLYTEVTDEEMAEAAAILPFIGRRGSSHPSESGRLVA